MAFAYATTATTTGGEDGRAAAFADMAGRWPRALLVEDPAGTAVLAARVFDPAVRRGSPLPLHLCGTNFQIRVWEALLRLPPGALATYGDLAAAIGEPRSARAVGAAAGANPISRHLPFPRAIPSRRNRTNH